MNRCDKRHHRCLLPTVGAIRRGKFKFAIRVIWKGCGKGRSMPNRGRPPIPQEHQIRSSSRNFIISNVRLRVDTPHQLSIGGKYETVRACTRARRVFPWGSFFGPLPPSDERPLLRGSPFFLATIRRQPLLCGNNKKATPSLWQQ